VESLLVFMFALRQRMPGKLLTAMVGPRRQRMDLRMTAYYPAAYAEINRKAPGGHDRDGAALPRAAGLTSQATASARNSGL
jgi:hypothetical protein